MRFSKFVCEKPLTVTKRIAKHFNNPAILQAVSFCTMSRNVTTANCWYNDHMRLVFFERVQNIQYVYIRRMFLKYFLGLTSMGIRHKCAKIERIEYMCFVLFSCHGVNRYCSILYLAINKNYRAYMNKFIIIFVHVESIYRIFIKIRSQTPFCQN